jgi:hypothetical protein
MSGSGVFYVIRYTFYGFTYFGFTIRELRLFRLIKFSVLLKIKHSGDFLYRHILPGIVYAFAGYGIIVSSFCHSESVSPELDSGKLLVKKPIRQ